MTTLSLNIRSKQEHGAVTITLFTSLYVVHFTILLVTHSGYITISRPPAKKAPLGLGISAGVAAFVDM